MEGTQAIIFKILDDANSKANSIIENANNVVSSKRLDAENFVNEYSNAQLSSAKNEAKEIIKRKEFVAGLEVRKILLSKKQQLISETFDLALRKLRNIDKANYIKLVEQLLVDYADEGDKIILSNDNVISSLDIEKLEVFKAKKMSIDDVKGNFVGGVMLEGKVSDKNFTFESIINDYKQKLSSQVASDLFKVE